LYYAKIKNVNHQLSIIDDYIKCKTTSKASSKNLFDFNNSTMITRNEIIKRFETVLDDNKMSVLKFNIDSGDCILKYTEFYSKINTRFIGQSQYSYFNSYLGDVSSNLINYLDNSIEYLARKKDDNTKRISYYLKFKGRDVKEIDENELGSKLSCGTIRWIKLFESAIYILKFGGYLIIDELESSIHKALAIDIIKLFSSKETNKLGSTLVFTTHYSELLDYIKRNDSIYVTSKETDGYSKIINLADLLKRSVREKSEAYLKNMLGETTTPNRDIFNLLVREIIDFDNNDLNFGEGE
jgi:hypothetical protein